MKYHYKITQGYCGITNEKKPDRIITGTVMAVNRFEAIRKAKNNNGTSGPWRFASIVVKEIQDKKDIR